MVTRFSSQRYHQRVPKWRRKSNQCLDCLTVAKSSLQPLLTMFIKFLSPPLKKEDLSLSFFLVETFQNDQGYNYLACSSPFFWLTYHAYIEFGWLMCAIFINLGSLQSHRSRKWWSGRNGMCFGWMRGLFLRIMKTVIISQLLMAFYRRYCSFRN